MTNPRTVRLPLVLLIAIGTTSMTCGLSGCGRAGSNDRIATASDGESGVSASEIRSLIDGLPEPARSTLWSDRVALEKFVRAELMRRSLLAEAETARLESDPHVAEQVDRARSEVLVRQWVARQSSVPAGYPGDDELQLAYRTNAAALKPPTRYRVAQVFVAAPNGIAPSQLAVAMRKAAAVGAQIPSGDFAALAREHSEHAESAARGGDVGLLPANQMLPEIVAAVDSLEVGATAGPVKTSQGLHYVKLLEKVVPPTPSFDEAREPLRSALRARRAQELEQAYLAALSDKLDVAVNQLALAEIVPDGKTAGAKP